MDPRRLAAGFEESLAGGYPGKIDYYGIAARGDPSFFLVTLTFKKGVRYCCAEPECHVPIKDKAWWSRLRSSLGRQGIRAMGKMEFRLRLIVEEGALFLNTHQATSYVPSKGHSFDSGPHIERT